VLRAIVFCSTADHDNVDERQIQSMLANFIMGVVDSPSESANPAS
tara:strand:+ start:87061 stop:87195 length:135 start_codon:yes stop_codon:yes gene_type:complete